MTVPVWSGRRVISSWNGGNLSYEALLFLDSKVIAGLRLSSTLLESDIVKTDSKIFQLLLSLCLHPRRGMS
jgi:hypothetical protein